MLMQNKILSIMKNLDGIQIHKQDGQVSVTFPIKHLIEFVKVIREDALKEAGAYPLPDDLYPDSKDWREATYYGRVEWLHMAYENAKMLIREYENMLAQQPETAEALHGLVKQNEQANESESP